MSKASKQRNREKRQIKLSKAQTENKIKEYIVEQTRLSGEWKEIEVMCPHCTKVNFCYIFEDKKTLFCMACSKEFDIDDIDTAANAKAGIDIELIADETNGYLSAEYAQASAEANRQLDKTKHSINKSISQLQLPGVNQTKQTHAGFSGWNKVEYGYRFTSCTHNPQHVIAGRTGWGVWAGKKEDCKNRANEYDIVLNLTWTTIKQIHKIPVPELKEFESYGNKYTEIQLDWPDYGTIDLPRKFWEKLIKYLMDNRLRMLVFCQGGHGRTGTAIATLMVVALGYTPLEAVTWLRKNYCRSAVETQGQYVYVKRMAEIEAVKTVAAGSEGK